MVNSKINKNNINKNIDKNNNKNNYKHNNKKTVYSPNFPVLHTSSPTVLCSSSSLTNDPKKTSIIQ